MPRRRRHRRPLPQPQIQTRCARRPRPPASWSAPRSSPSFLTDPRYSAVLSRHFDYLTAEYQNEVGSDRADARVPRTSPAATPSPATPRRTACRSRDTRWSGTRRSRRGWRLCLPRICAPRSRATSAASRPTMPAGSSPGTSSTRRSTTTASGCATPCSATSSVTATSPTRSASPARPTRRRCSSTTTMAAKASAASRTAIYELVRGLLAQGVPIDGVGLQMHVSRRRAARRREYRRQHAPARRPRAARQHQRDGRSHRRHRPAPRTRASIAQKSAYHYDRRASASPSRRAMPSRSGASPTRTPWIYSRSTDAPLLFDAQYAAKPAFAGVFDALMHR